MKILIIIWFLFLLALIYVEVMFAKNEVTYNQRMKIYNGISMYCNEQYTNGEEPDVDMFGRVEDYDKTLHRIWDWGCKNILPPEDYEKIKKYL